MDLVIFLPLLIVLGAFMFFSTRRQKKAMQATVDLHQSLRVGDRVHTTAGLEATIAALGDDTVDLEIAPGIVTTWLKVAVRDRIESKTADEDEVFASDTDDTDDDVSAPDSPAELTQSDGTVDPNRLSKD